jgi:hypothetical protein
MGRDAEGFERSGGPHHEARDKFGRLTEDVVRSDADLQERLRDAAATSRMIFLAGLPGTGKSFFVHRLAQLAHDGGRPVHLLQWDVARPVFEATSDGKRYPMKEGITHPVIRKAAGTWARWALAQWDQRHSEPIHILIGETPLVGHRFIELARPAHDAAERLLAAPACLFFVPVPSVEVRRSLEAERGRRTARPITSREREDAAPSVLHEMWDELAAVAERLDPLPAGGVPPAFYNPVVYERVYRHVLAHRRTKVIRVKGLSPDAPSSAYLFGFAVEDVVPAPEEAAEFIRRIEASYPDLTELQREVRRWYVV